MPGWTNFSDFIQEVTTNGKYKYAPFFKIAPSAIGANRWTECYTWAGVPGAGAQSGAAGTGVQIKQSVQGAGIDIGANVSPDIRSLLTLQAWTTSFMYPATAILVDFLAYYPSLVVTGAPTTLTTVALPRYQDGVGVQAIIAVQTALGAATPALTLTCTYNDDASAAASAALTSPLNSAPVSQMFSRLGTPFAPLPTGKTGIKTINSYTIDSGGTTGTVCAFLVKPLSSIPILSYSTPYERDLMTQLPSLPRIYDDAHLGWILLTGGGISANDWLGGFAGMGWG